MSKIVKPEFTGWRDEALSRRHRLWGFDCPVVDIDFMMHEYDYGNPVAIIDYKHETAPQITFKNNNGLVANRNLCNAAGIYFFVVRYCRRTINGWRQYRFKVFSGNEKARELLNSMGANGVIVDEEWFVEFLYSLRGREVPTEVLNKIRGKAA